MTVVVARINDALKNVISCLVGWLVLEDEQEWTRQQSTVARCYVGCPNVINLQDRKSVV